MDFKRYKQENNSELKSVDVRISVSAIPDTVTTNDHFNLLTHLNSGSDYYQRTGRHVYWHSVQAKGYIKCSISSEATTNSIQGMILYGYLLWDETPSGSTPNFNQIFGDVDEGGVSEHFISSNLLPWNHSRFEIFKRVVLPVDPTSMNVGGSENITEILVPVEFYLDLPKLHSVFKANSGTPQNIADVESGALYFVLRANDSTSGIAIANPAELSFRLRYTD